LRKGLKTISSILIISSLLKIVDIFKNLLIASQFGVSENADVFSTVIILPEYLLIFLGFDTLRGVVNSEYSTWQIEKKNMELYNSFVGISSLLIKVTPLLIIILIIFKTQVISLLLPGFTGEKKKLAEVVLLIISPLVFFRSFIGFFQSLLNSFKSFYLPVIATSLVSFTIIFLIVFKLPTSELLFNIAIGTLFGNLLFFMIIGVGSFKALSVNLEMSLSWRFFIKELFTFKVNKSTLKVIKSCYSLFFVVIANVLFLGSKNYLASFFGDGMLSSINYASSIPTVITTLIFTSFFAYFLNRIASIETLDNENKQSLFFKTLTGMLFLITLLVSFLTVNAREVLEVLFHRGNFTEVGISLTYYPFIWEILSMITFVITIIPTAFFIGVKKYSILNKIGTILYLCGIVVCVIFSNLFGYAGISAGVFFTQLIYGVLLLYLVNKEIGGFFIYVKQIVGIICVALITMVIILGFKQYILKVLIFPNLDFYIQSVLYVGILHITIFFIASHLFGIEYYKKITKNYFNKNEI